MTMMITRTALMIRLTLEIWASNRTNSECTVYRWDCTKFMHKTISKSKSNCNCKRVTGFALRHSFTSFMKRSQRRNVYQVYWHDLSRKWQGFFDYFHVITAFMCTVQNVHAIYTEYQKTRQINIYSYYSYPPMAALLIRVKPSSCKTTKTWTLHGQ